MNTLLLLQLLQRSHSKPKRTSELADWMGQFELPFSDLFLIFASINAFVILYTIIRIAARKIDPYPALFFLVLLGGVFWLLHLSKADTTQWIIGSMLTALTAGNAAFNKTESRS